MEFGAGKVLNKSFVLVSRGGQDWKQLRVAKSLLMFQMHGGREESDEKQAFTQYLECPTPLDKINEKLGLLRLRCSTEDEVDNTIKGSMSTRSKWPETG